MADPATDLTEDLFLGGRLRLRQLRKGHRAGHDAMLLAAATRAQAGDRVVEFGAGVGAAGLALATRVPGIDLTLVELDGRLAALAQDNTALNGISARVVTLDVTGVAASFMQAGLPADYADVVLMNPPFNDPARHRASIDPARVLAHVTTDTTLTDWLHAARRTLRSGGELTLIWRADGLGDVVAAMHRGFGSVVVRPVHATADANAIRVIVSAIKGGRAPLRLESAIVIESDHIRNALASALAIART